MTSTTAASFLHGSRSRRVYRKVLPGANRGCSVKRRQCYCRVCLSVCLSRRRHGPGRKGGLMDEVASERADGEDVRTAQRADGWNEEGDRGPRRATVERIIADGVVTNQSTGKKSTESSPSLLESIADSKIWHRELCRIYYRHERRTCIASC